MNRTHLPDELRAMAGQSESPAASSFVATFLHTAAEEFEAAGFTHEDALSLALQGERFLAEQSRDERGREEMAAVIIEQASHLTSTQVEDLSTAWRAAQDSAQGAALVAARDAASDASQGAALDAARWAALDAARHTARHADRGTAHTAWNAGWDVVLGLLAKDSISVEDFRTLTGPWASVMGPIEVAA